MNSIWHISDPRRGSCDARRIADGGTRRGGDSAILLWACLALLAPVVIAQQTKPPAERDLRVEKDAVPGQAKAVGIPRSYALVVGISNYQNLAAAQQLQFPERDAEAIYSILISTEGGNFRAENVHKLIGARATLARLRLDPRFPGLFGP